MLLLDVLAAYALLGLVVAPAFVIFGIPRIMPQVSLTAATRVVLLPGAAALWPLIVARWLKARGRP